MSYTPDYSQNPTGADLVALLTAQGLWKTAYAGFEDGFVAASVERFEQMTDRQPFLALASRTLYFDPPSIETGYPTDRKGLRMDLPVLFSGVSAVYTGCSNEDYTTGRAATLGRDVYLEPNNHALKNLPVEQLLFQSVVSSGTRSIAVTGTPGSYATWPADAFNAVVAGAAAEMGAQVISGAIGGGLASWKEADVAETFGELKAALGSNIELWQSLSKSATRRYLYIRGS